MNIFGSLQPHFSFYHFFFIFQPRQSFSPVRNSPSSSKEKTAQSVDEEEKKSSTINNNKQPRNKWVPLEINVGKNNKVNKNRQNRSSADGQSTVSEGDKDWRAEIHDYPRNGRHSRSVSAAPRGRGMRNRGGMRGPIHRSMNREHNNEHENEVTTDFHHVSFL